MQGNELAEVLPRSPSITSERLSDLTAVDLKGRSVRGGVTSVTAQAATFVLRIAKRRNFIDERDAAATPGSKVGSLSDKELIVQARFLFFRTSAEFRVKRWFSSDLIGADDAICLLK